MQQQEQGNNAWIGGSIGTGLGILGSELFADYAGYRAWDYLSNDKKFEDKIKFYKDKSTYRSFDPAYKAANKISEMRSEARAKTRLYAGAVPYLIRFVLPITSGLLGSTLTD